MHKENLIVSIIVPAYNAEASIKKCIESVLQQSYLNIELIIVDDGSTDQTAKLCDNYATEDTRVRVIHKQNAGVSAARNTGVSVAKGELIVFLDADDWLDLDIIKLGIETYTTDCINMWGATEYFLNGVITNEELKVPNLSSEELIANVVYTVKSDSNNLGTFFRAVWGKFFEREIIEKYHIVFPEEMYMGEDAVFLVKYLAYVSGIHLISETGYNYNRGHEASATTKYHSDLYEQSEYQYKELIKVIEEEQLLNSEIIRTAFVNFRWWMVTSLVDNSVKGVVEGRLPITKLFESAMCWINIHKEEMRKNVTDISYISKRHYELYLHRKNLNKYVLYRYYLVPQVFRKVHKRLGLLWGHRHNNS